VIRNILSFYGEEMLTSSQTPKLVDHHLSAVRECLFNIFAATLHVWGYVVVQLVEALRYKSEGRGFYSRWSHWSFSLTSSFRPQYGPGVDSDSNRNE